MGKKLSIFTIPRFQQGGVIWRDNIYSSPVNTSNAIQLIAAPEDVGYTQNLQNIELQTKLRAQNFDEINNTIKLKLYNDELTAKVEQNKIDNNIKLLNLRTEYRDKVTNDAIDPMVNDAIMALQERHKINETHPLNIDGLTEQQNRLDAYFSDPEYKQLKTHSVLLTDNKARIDKATDALNDWKIKDQETFMDYNMPEYETKLNEMRSALLSVKPGDFQSLLKARNELDKFNLQLTPEAQKEMKLDDDFKIKERQAKLDLQSIKTNELAIKADLSLQYSEAVKAFKDAKTPEEKQKIIETIMLLSKQAKNLSGFAEPANAITSESEFKAAYAMRDPRITDDMAQRYIDISGAIVGEKTKARLDETQDAKISINKDNKGTVYLEDNTGLKDYGTYMVDKTNAVKSITINKKTFSAADLQQTNPGGIVFKVEPRNVKISKNGPMENRNYAVMEIYGNTLHGENYLNGLIGAENLDKTVDEKLKILLSQYLMGRYNDPDKVKRIMSGDLSTFLKGNGILALPSDRPNMTTDNTQLAPGVQQASSVSKPW
jgi:hypothetical protein